MPDQLGLIFQSAETFRRTWTVRDLVSAVRTAVERAYTDVYVEGEISNYKPAESGHLYFTLKDGDAQLSAIMFRAQARLLRFKPANGMQVIARGRITVYESRGQLQLSAEYLEPKGPGALQVAFEQLKARLASEGLFDRERKKPLPAMPRRIGIVTSPRGAAIQDMLNVLRRRHESVNIVIFPAQVQGDQAALEVRQGIEYFNRRKTGPVDVIVVARGGGSAEDLAAFNDEHLARAIAASTIPVISAVGHETDFTIADFVADLRAPTPSAAAELVIESKRQIEDRSLNLARRLQRAVEYRLMVARRHLADLSRHAAFSGVRDLLNRRQQRLDDVQLRLRDSLARLLRQYQSRFDLATARIRAHDLRRVLAAIHRQLDSARSRAVAAAQQRLARDRVRLAQATARLNALSPLNILERGYALAFDASGTLVKDPAQVGPGDELTLRVARGTIDTRVR